MLRDEFQVGAWVKLIPASTRQMRNALINVGLACKVAKSTIYVVNPNPSMMQNRFEAVQSIKDKYNFPDMALPLISVYGLFIPGMLVEIEALCVSITDIPPQKFVS